MGKPRQKESILNVDGLEARVVRKAVKNIRLRVKAPDGRLELSVPFGTGDAFIQDLVRAKKPWIEAQRAKLAGSTRARAAEAPPEEQAEWKTVVAACVPTLVAKWEPVLGVRAGKLVYRNMTSRWGSCQPSTGRICINTRLALYPPECLEYVVVHELCHLLVRNHSSEFWGLVEAALPHWREARDKLRG